MPHEVEVLVAGAGAAGCAAALAAAQAGLDVVLIEAEEHFRSGCNTSMSTSMVPAGGSRWQDALGVDDSPEQFRADIFRKTRGAADPVLAAALTDVAPQLVAWMNDDCDVPLDLVTDFLYPGHTRHRCHSVNDRAGATMHSHLLAAVARSPKITMAVPMRMNTLVESPDPAGGWVVSMGDAKETVTATNVILATSGFGGDRGLVSQYLPEIADGLYFGGESSNGLAMRLAGSLSADTAFLDAYQGHGSVAVPMQVLLTWASIVHGGFMVNAVGERFGNESTGYSEFGSLVMRQPGGEAWVIYDRRIHELLIPFKDYRDILDQGGPKWVDDAAALATLIGASTEALDRTLQEANDAAQGRRACPQGRTNWGEALSGPLAVQRVTGALFHTQGGMYVDGQARVRRNGEPLAGLYAAGGAAHGISGHGADGYLAGNGLLGALGLGLIAGRDAAKATDPACGSGETQ
ncbi:MAG: fumarate reductase flavoprotein subunit [Glaciecola sp.]|jgi:fumarate reductase flavoprotein subunit